MEMYADPDARGGVLEPEGIVEIKFRQKDIIKTIDRLDPVVTDVRKYCILLKFMMNFFFSKKKIFLQLRNKLKTVSDPEELAKIEKDIRDRQKRLSAAYHPVAVHFADLHDTPERMLEKGAILVILSLILGIKLIPLLII